MPKGNRIKGSGKRQKNGKFASKQAKGKSKK